MKITLKRISEADNLARLVIARNKDGQRSKFFYAWKRFCDKNYSSYVQELQEQLTLVRISNALEDANKAIITDKENMRGYKFSKEGLKKCIEEENKLIKEFQEKEVEAEPYFCLSLPEMSDEEKEVFKGMIIKP